jgi:hypothetical protein
MSWTKASTVFSGGMANKRGIICGDMLKNKSQRDVKEVYYFIYDVIYGTNGYPAQLP